jgi:hypothetical protein
LRRRQRLVELAVPEKELERPERRRGLAETAGF